MSVRLHIEHLILEGLPIEQRHSRQLRAAVMAELARVVAGEASPASAAGAHASVQAPAMRLPVSADPAQVGKCIGQAVGRGIGSLR